MVWHSGVGPLPSEPTQEVPRRGWGELGHSASHTHLKQRVYGAQDCDEGRLQMVLCAGARPLHAEPAQEVPRTGLRELGLSRPYPHLKQRAMI